MRKTTKKASTKARAAKVEHEIITVKLLIMVKALTAGAAVRALLTAAQEIVDQGQEDAP